MELSELTPQTIWQSANGEIRLRAVLVDQSLGQSDPKDLSFYYETFEDDAEFESAGWYASEMVTFCPEQALAVKIAIDSYLLQSGVIQGVEIGVIEEPDHESLILWDDSHNYGDQADPDLTLYLDIAATWVNPSWILACRYGEEITLNAKALTWLAWLLPRIQSDHKSAKRQTVPMEGSK